MKNVLLILSIVCCFFACEKEEVEEIIDYRQQYVGDYFFKIDHEDSHVGRYPDPMTIKKTWYFSGSITIVEGSEDRVLVHWGDNPSESKVGYDIYFTQLDEMIVDTLGVLKFPGLLWPEEYFVGASLMNDTIRFRINQGGAGSWYTWSVRGVKESGN